MNLLHRTQGVLACTVILATTSCDGTSAGGGGSAHDIVIEESGMIPLREQTAKAIASAPAMMMNAAGLVGVVGGARIKALTAGPHEVLLPLPQADENQTPISYAIAITPQKAGNEFRLRPREGANVNLSVTVNAGKDEEIQLEWSAVVLVAGNAAPSVADAADAYRKPSPCVQSDAKAVQELADQLRSGAPTAEEYAAAIQQFIGHSQQRTPPRTLDAMGILESGANGICTANANLAAALLRAKNIPARSVAVIPPIGQRLEMHRIVEYFDRGQWRAFDPSSVQRDIPLKPWQNIVVVRTTIADEEIAMKPRMGTSLGCPYAQELELLDPGITLWGQDFFWTLGKPLAQFETSDEAQRLAKVHWKQFLAIGQLSASQIKAGSASNTADFLEAFRQK